MSLSDFTQPALFDLAATVDLSEALHYLKYRGQPMDASLEAQLEYAKEACEALNPKGVACIYENGKCPMELPGSAIIKFMGNAPAIALCAVTLGMESVRLIRREEALGVVRGVFADACASALVESAIDDLQVRLSASVAEYDLCATRRFSPGYGDLPLSIQREFIRTIGADKLLGISVTESDMLIPAKSVTAVMRLDEVGC